MTSLFGSAISEANYQNLASIVSTPKESEELIFALINAISEFVKTDRLFIMETITVLKKECKYLIYTPVIRKKTGKRSVNSEINKIKKVALEILQNNLIAPTRLSSWNRLLERLPFYVRGVYPSKKLNDLNKSITEWIDNLIKSDSRADTMQKALCQMAVSLGESLESLELLQRMYYFLDDRFVSAISRALAEKLIKETDFLNESSLEERSNFFGQLIPVIAYLIAHFGRNSYQIYENPSYGRTEFYEKDNIVCVFQWRKYKVYPMCHPLTDPAYRIVIVSDEVLGSGGFMEVNSAFTINGKEVAFKKSKNSNSSGRVEQAFRECVRLKTNPFYGFTTIMESPNVQLSSTVEEKMDSNLLDLINNGTLKRHTFKEREQIALNLLKLLADMHEIGAHRDFKLDNILANVENGKIVKLSLTDFEMMFIPSISAGSSYYTAPDLNDYAKGKSFFDFERDSLFMKKLDIWAMGLTIVSILDGRDGWNILINLGLLCANKIDKNKPFTQEDVNLQIDRLKELNLSDNIQKWCDLLKQMLNVSYLERPSVNQALVIAEEIIKSV